MHQYLRIVFCTIGLMFFGCNDSNFSGGNETAKPDTKKPPVKSEDAKIKDSDREPDLGKEDKLKDEKDEVIEDDTPEVEAEDNVLANIDSNCDGKSTNILAVFSVPIAPKSSMAKTVAGSCNGGFEFNNLENSSFTIRAKSTLKKSAPLDIEIASYTAADRMRIIAVFKDGSRKLVLDSCRLRTASYTDPTGGNQRPPEDSIRDFRLKLPKGTDSVEFDFTAAPTPTYMKVNGLCNFNLTPDSVSGAQPMIRNI